MPPSTRFGIAMKPQDRPVDLPNDYQRTLKNEFYARYLESIGAAPTPANLAQVKKHLPIEGCKFTTAWKSRGWMADYLYIAPQKTGSVQSSHARAVIQAAQEAKVTELLKPTLPATADDETELPNRKLHLGAPSGSMSFEDAKRTFLYPYKSENVANKRAGSPGRASSQGTESHSQRHEREHSENPSKFVSRDLHRYEQYTEEEVRLELQTMLNLHTKDIIMLQAEFVRTFPFETIKARVSQEDMRIGLSELSSKRTTRFIGLLTLLLYWSYLADHAGRKVEEEQLSALYCAVQHFFSSVRERMKKRRATLLFMLPTLLLLVRVSIEALFRQAFPKWWTTMDARDTLKTMDDAVEAIFDPNSYHSHLSPLESSTAAIRIAAKDQLGVKYNSRHAKYHATSALVSSALPKASMVSQHQLLAGTTLPAVATRLPEDVRRQLFTAALRKTNSQSGPLRAEASLELGASSPLKNMLLRAPSEPRRQRTDASPKSPKGRLRKNAA